MPRLTPEHIRAALYVLGWTRKELSEAAMLSETTLRHFDAGRTSSLQRRTERDLVNTLERNGIKMEETDDDDPRVVCSDGLVFRRSTPPRR